MPAHGRSHRRGLAGAVNSTLGRFLGLALLIWVAAWLPIGLWVGDPDFVLTRVSRGTTERQLYQWLLYGGLILAFFYFWQKHAPLRPKWGKPMLFVGYFVQGLLATLVLRGVLTGLELVSWSVPDPSLFRVVEVVGGCLAVALVEEALFRGFLLGTLAQKLGFQKGLILSSALFALVHLFRPGDVVFKLAYGLGLFLLGYLLGSIAWHHNAIFASAGFHGGIILLNIGTQVVTFQPSLWSGAESEPVSGAVSLLLTLLYLGGWKKFASGKGSNEVERHEENVSKLSNP
ncbi:MAG TPA: CPBP family intramembrane metalloprotease [Phycisphaerales bacterium]|nr:CPBP family intramembrane metalloprotease [Phycisphaerales bacterium]